MFFTTSAHHIKAFLLYPLNCDCEGGYHCESIRDKIVLSLNMELLTQAQARQDHPDQITAMKMIFKIPDESYFKVNYAHSYPVLIDERFNRKTRTRALESLSSWYGVFSGLPEPMNSLL
jgi:hypothetical protein